MEDAMSATAETNTSSFGAGTVDDRRLMLAFGGLLVAMFIGALDQTIWPRHCRRSRVSLAV
jgi:hypothetical protein